MELPRPYFMVNLSSIPTTKIQMFDFGEHVTHSLDKAFRDRTDGDVTLIVGETKEIICCHKLVLMFCSKFLRDLLKDVPAGAAPSIVIPDIQPDIMGWILEYIYTGELKLDSKRLIEFIDSCNLLDLGNVINKMSKKHETYPVQEDSSTYVEYLDDEIIAERELEAEDENMMCETPEVEKPSRFVEPTCDLEFVEVVVDPLVSGRESRKMSDGGALISAVNLPYFRERLDSCVAKTFENVASLGSSRPLYSLKLFYCKKPPKLKATMRCHMCDNKVIKISYKYKNDQFKQWVNSNLIRHLEVSHKERWLKK